MTLEGVDDQLARFMPDTVTCVGGDGCYRAITGDFLRHCAS